MKKILLAFVMTYLFTSVAYAADEWIEIPVVVNVVDNSDDSKVTEALKKANEIFKQAKIKLVVKKTNKPYNVGNNDGDLTEAEGDDAQKDGKKELDNVAGAGKGLKLTIADNCWVEEPNTVGWAIHRSPVVVVEPDADVEEMAKTIAHEMCHSLTLEHDHYDPNDINLLMYGYQGSGTHLEPNDIAEIRMTAKKRGKTFTIQPTALPGNKKETTASGISNSIDAHGAILDEFNDQNITEPVFNDPFNPENTYGDIREIIVFADEPMVPNSTFSIDIELGGLIPLWPANGIHQLYFDMNDVFPGPELVLDIQMENTTVIFAEIFNIQVPSQPPIPVIVDVYQNDKFDAFSTIPNNKIPVNNSLEIFVPIEIVQVALVSSAPIQIVFQSQWEDFRLEPPFQILDITPPFEFKLSDICILPTIAFSGGISEPDGSCGDDVCFNWDLYGWGFTPNTLFEVQVGNNALGAATASTDSSGNLVVSNIGSSGLDGVSIDLGPDQYEVFVQELDDTGPEGAPHAFGFFNYFPFGPIVGDLDGDGDVDLDDFALMAGNWLVGK